MDLSPSPLVLVLLGPPGSGKGTQATLLKEQLQLPHISTGELLRGHVKKETALGKEAKSYIEQGELVPDELILDMLFERVADADCARGYILDGFPRTIPQAKSLQDRLKGKAHLTVIHFVLSDAKVLERLTKRVVCPNCGTPYHLLYSPPKEAKKCDHCKTTLIQRADDTEAVILQRLQVYHQQTAPLIDFYSKQNLLYTISCDQSKEALHKELIEKIRSGK